MFPRKKQATHERVVSGTTMGAGGPLHLNLGLDSPKRDSFSRCRDWSVMVCGELFPAWACNQSAWTTQSIDALDWFA